MAKNEIETNEVTTADESTTTQANGTLGALLDTDKVKAIRAALGGDRVAFESTPDSSAYDQAAEFLAKVAEKTSNFHGLPLFLGKSLESAGRIMLATVGVRDKGDKAKGIAARNGYKAIVAFEQPSVATFLADSSKEAIDFVAKLIEREATDVAFSGIRNASTEAELRTVMEGLPTDVASIVTTSRASSIGEGIFDKHWADFRKGVIAVKWPNINKALPQKPDFIKALRSKSWAEANPVTAPLEERDYFAKITGLFIQACEGIDDDSIGADIDLVKEWLANRESLNLDFTVKTVDAEDLETLDF